MAENFRPANPEDRIVDERISNMIDECKRQEESCLYTSTTLYEWLKCLRCWKAVFVVVPIILGGLASWPLLAGEGDSKWITGVCALLAGLAPAIYKALDFDVSLDVVSNNAREFKILQDRLRQAWRITAYEAPEEFAKVFGDIMNRMDAARSSGLTAPERYFLKARKKIEAGHYVFNVDQR